MMAGRFTTRRANTPDTTAIEDAPPADGVAWTVFPEAPGGEPTLVPNATAAVAPAPATQVSANPLLTDKLLDAKVRLHKRLIEEFNLSALDKLPEEQIRAHVTQLVSQYVLTERLALNAQELNDFVSEILDKKTGLGPQEPLLKDPSITDILGGGRGGGGGGRGGGRGPRAGRGGGERRL